LKVSLSKLLKPYLPRRGLSRPFINKGDSPDLKQPSIHFQGGTGGFIRITSGILFHFVSFFAIKAKKPVDISRVEE
jgi:hypothetical protein